jgi:hypothetical protein
VCNLEQFFSELASIRNTETMTTTTVLKFDSVRNNQPYEKRLNWKIAPVLTLFHVGAVAALFFFTWHALFVALFLYWVTVGLGSA